MLLSLNDNQLRARITRIPGDRYRLTLEYPINGSYTARVRVALADLLRPPMPQEQEVPTEPDGMEEVHDTV